ncbi:MAG: guanylate kinase [Clostridiales Family XIII bacterium]|jgi:guanylate kinase|nr:guanylate kinase [Clostridiales Family XIII bacterium]
MKKGRLFVISGPSGTGKGTICRSLLKTVDAALSVSMTTREPRLLEKDGESYFFVTKKRFDEVVSEGGFYEYAEVYGEFYGTPKAPVEKRLSDGGDVILEIDTQGAMQVKEACPDGIFVFILPPSMAVLRSRIVGRGSEPLDKINIRMGKAENEIGFLVRYDYCVVNENLSEAVSDVAAIMRAEHLRVGEDAEARIEKYRNE